MRPCSARHRAQGGPFLARATSQDGDAGMAPEGAVPAFLFARPLRVLNPQLWAKRFGPGRAAPEETRRRGWAGSAGCGVRNWRSGRTARSQCPDAIERLQSRLLRIHAPERRGACTPAAPASDPRRAAAGANGVTGPAFRRLSVTGPYARPRRGEEEKQLLTAPPPSSPRRRLVAASLSQAPWCGCGRCRVAAWVESWGRYWRALASSRCHRSPAARSPARSSKTEPP